MVHAELMTHRVFSRSASSSHAIPIMTMIKAILSDPAAPFKWGTNQRGMQAGDGLKGLKLTLVRWCWFMARYPAIMFALIMVSCGVHKQIANRILEPWGHISVIVTSTEWSNFFGLRVHPDADPTIRELAAQMLDAYNLSGPRYRDEHLPYLTGEERRDPYRFEMSSARCTRVSFPNHDGKKPSRKEDMSLFRRLVGGVIKHASPTEHQAYFNTDAKSSNLRAPWHQYRKDIEGENID